jgi:hypothetical protein
MQIEKLNAAAERHQTMVAFLFTSTNKQSKHRAQSRPRPSAPIRFDASLTVFASLAV